MNYILRLICLIILISASSGLPQTVKLTILETSDIHGTLYPYDFKNQRPLTHSMAHIYSLVKEKRSKNPDGVILLDNGDMLQGQPSVYYYNFERSDTLHLYSQVMNYMKYDAAVIGNHDIETGHPVYDKFRGELNFPWLAANAVEKESGRPYFEPYTIIERQGIKIAVIGLTTPGIPNWLPEEIWAGMAFEDMIKSAKKWIAIVEEKEKPDVVIGLFHSGVDYTYNHQDENTEFNENASHLIARQVPGFDVIFTGHDHKNWNFFADSKDGSKVLVLGPASEGRIVPAADITLEYDAGSSSWTKKISGSLIDIAAYSPDSNFMSDFEYGRLLTENYVNDEVGYIKKSVSSRDAVTGPSLFTDLIHAFQLEVTGADVSFAAPLSFDAEIKEGAVKVRDLFNLYKYENLLYTMNLTGSEIKRYLEFSYSLWFNTMTSPEDDLLLYKSPGEKKSLANSYYNFSSAAGIIYTVDVTRPAGERVEITALSGGRKFYEDSVYTAAVNSYRGNGGGGHLTLGAGISKEDLSRRIKYTTQKDLRYYLMQWLKEKKTYNPSAVSEWKVLPEDYFKKGKEKALKELFR